MDPVSVYIPSRIPGTSVLGSARQLCIALVGRPWPRGRVRYEFFPLKIWIHLIHRQTQIKEKKLKMRMIQLNHKIKNHLLNLMTYKTFSHQQLQIGQNILWPNQQMKTLHLQN